MSSLTEISDSNGYENNSINWGVTCNTEDLFNPYKLGEAIGLDGKLADNVTNLFGWTVEYFKTDPDANGIDHTFHEYQLYNIVKYGDLKVVVPENQFPDNSITFNQFDLALFDSFEVHITKDAFKILFGVEKRPSKEDFMWFCDISKMYKVDHAQAVRDFAHTSTYYKLILSKFNQKASVKPINTSINDEINSIVKNSTLEDLFGTEIKRDQDKIAMKKQFDTLTNDRVRNVINATVTKELIDNAELVISKYNYDLSTATPSVAEYAVSYKDSDYLLKVSDNRSFYAWFKFQDFVDADTYNLINNYAP